MAKYVCDVEQVTAAGDNLIKMASTLKSNVSSYSREITSDLANWTGSAKNSFSPQCDSQVELAQDASDEAQKIGEFLKSSAQAIQSLDDELASLSI